MRYQPCSVLGTGAFPSLCAGSLSLWTGSGGCSSPQQHKEEVTPPRPRGELRGQRRDRAHPGLLPAHWQLELMASLSCTGSRLLTNYQMRLLTNYQISLVTARRRTLSCQGWLQPSSGNTKEIDDRGSCNFPGFQKGYFSYYYNV